MHDVDRVKQKGITDLLGAGLLIKACMGLVLLNELSLGLWSSGYNSGGNNNNNLE